MKKMLLVLSLCSSLPAMACQYGFGWNESAVSVVEEVYGRAATEIKVEDVLDRSMFIFERNTGANCPDYIRAIAKISFKLDGKQCNAKVLLETYKGIPSLKKVYCKVGF